MPEFTKGEWKAYLSDEHGWCVAIGLPGNDCGKANAHLIAAAPELYEVCKTVLKFGLCDESEKMLTEAIEKAEGRPTR